MLIIPSTEAEFEWAKKLEKASINLGWKCEITSQNSDPSAAIQQFKPDFAISLRDESIYSYGVLNYLAITIRSPYQFNTTTREKNSKFFDFDGYLLATPSLDTLKHGMEAKGKLFHAISWYPSCFATEFVPLNRNNLFYWGFWLDTRLDKVEYLKLFSLLDNEGYLNAYGLPFTWNFIPHSFKGHPTSDGECTLHAMQEAGIALVLHSKQHFESGAPSSRVFEAVAAGAVMICDRHPFIVQEFGDSVLYLDDVLNGKDLFHQIDAHVKWIFSHRNEADLLAKKAHSIFMNKFTLEKQLVNLAKFHESILIEGPALPKF